MGKLTLPRKLFRSVSTDATQLDKESRSMKISFSSETPVERWFGNEIISHKEGAMDMSRLNDGAPLLFNHDMDQQIGVVERAWIEGGKGYAEIRFSNSPLGQEKMQDVQDNVLRNVSFGYRINEIVLARKGKENEPSDYLVTRSLPYEISLVTVPADNNVGVGRSEDKDSDFEIEVRSLEPETATEVVVEEPKIITEAAKPAERTITMPEINEAVKAERERIAAIDALSEKHGHKDLARQLKESGATIEEVRAAYLEKLGARQVPVAKPEDGMIPLTETEQKSYSLVRAIRAQVSGNWKEAGFEKELSDEIAKRMDKESAGFFMPLNIKMDGTRATYATGAANTGGALVATNLLSDSFIELLRNKMLVMQLGARTLSGLVGNIAIPKQLTAGQAYWVTEGADVTQAEATFGTVAMTPKTVGSRSQMTRQMMLQGTPDIELLARNDLTQVLALAIDAAAISGTGSSGQPRGILNQSGIGAVAMGTNGAAFTNIDPLIDLETLVATANADFGSLAYLTNPNQVGKLKKLKDTTNNYLWNGYEAAVGAAVPGSINGYNVGRSVQVPANLTKGTSNGICSAAIFGNWSDLIIGQWGPGIEILANPFGAGFNSGGVDIRALATVDVAVRNAVSFAAITDLL